MSSPSSGGGGSKKDDQGLATFRDAQGRSGRQQRPEHYSAFAGVARSPRGFLAATAESGGYASHTVASGGGAKADRSRVCNYGTKSTSANYFYTTPTGAGAGGMIPSAGSQALPSSALLSRRPVAPNAAHPTAPSTGQFRSGHMEVDTLYGGSGGSASDGGGGGGGGGVGLSVNAMNAPNNSTMQCGCENIDCPFCNLMLSVQMKDAGGY